MGILYGKSTKPQPLQYSKNSFNLIKIIGKGGFGRVWKVTDKKTKQVYALKIMDKAKVIVKKSVTSIMNQRQLLANINNPFLVNMISAFQDRENLYLLIDYLDGGDLRYYISRNYTYNEQQIKFIIRCIMQGLHYLHEKNILHRDIKPENIIFDENGYCRITDLGVARFWKTQNAYETSGTPGYMSPEVLMRQNHSFCADYYAVGVIAFQLLIGKRPYNGKSRKQIRDDVLARQARIPSSFSGASDQCVDFINKMIQRLARKRLGFNGISEILDHPWLSITKKQRQQFKSKKMPSPFITVEVNHSNSLYEMTEPNQVMKQTMIILKKPEVQSMFNNYEYPSIQKDNKNTDLNSTTFTTV